MLGLPWSAVDWTNERLSITDTVVVVDHRPTLRIDETKTKSSRRVIALDSTTMHALRAHRSRQAEEKLVAGEAYDDQGLVVAGKRGQIFPPDLFTRTVKRLAGEAGVTPLGPHAARHSFATISLSRGVGVKTVAERLGHASVQTTWDRYGHMVEGQDRALADLFAEAIE